MSAAEPNAPVDLPPTTGSTGSRWLLAAMTPVALFFAVSLAFLSFFGMCGYDGCGPDWRSTRGPYLALVVALMSAGILVVPFLAIGWASRRTQLRVAGAVAAVWWVVLAVLIFWPKDIVPTG